MKKFFVFLSALLISFSVKATESQTLDYSNKANWMLFASNKSASVDLFYLYPTSVPNTCKTDIGEVEANMKKQAMLTYVKGPSCMASFTNVYAPYYRQLSGVSISKAKDAASLEKLLKESIVIKDACAALDYYFKYQNNGRPFILAGHSQGSACLKLILADYMKAHPEYLKQMVACYALGFCFSDSWFAANPHIKKATGADDTKVLISWNCEIAGGNKTNLAIENSCYVINPLNWQTDETPADIKLNHGSLELNMATQKSKIVKGKVGTKINLKRGVLVCNGAVKPLPPNPFFGDHSLHFDDWSLFYINIQENAQQRIQAYSKK